MSTMQLHVSDGKFVGVYGVPITEFTDTHIVGNGWFCDIKSNGMIWCSAEADHHTGKYCLTYTIRDDGFARLTISEPNKKPRTIRKGFVVPKGNSISGTIMLSGGIVCKRNAYFRSNHQKKSATKIATHGDKSN